MIDEANKLRKDISSLEFQVLQSKAKLEIIEKSCNHDFTTPLESFETYDSVEVDYDNPEKHGAFLKYNYKSVQKKRPVFTRMCLKCGKVETTRKTKENISHVPDFS